MDSIPGLVQWAKESGIATVVAQAPEAWLQLLAQKLPYATGMAIKNKITYKV